MLHFPHHGHTQRPAVLNRLEVAADGLLALFVQALQPLTDRFVPRLRLVKSHVKGHIGIHAEKRTIFGTECNLLNKMMFSR